MCKQQSSIDDYRTITRYPIDNLCDYQLGSLAILVITYVAFGSVGKVTVTNSRPLVIKVAYIAN